MSRCRSCGLYDGAHDKNCMAEERAARKKLQAGCDHRSDYGVTRTTGDPPGPRRCGRCGLELPVLSDQAELWDNVDSLRPVGGGFDIAIPPTREPLIVQTPTLLSLVDDQFPQYPERDVQVPVRDFTKSWEGWTDADVKKETDPWPPAVKFINCRHPDELRKQILTDPPEVEWCGACGSIRTWTIDEPPKPVLDADRDGNGWFPPLRALELKQPDKALSPSPRGPTPHLPARWDGEVRGSIPAQELADLAERHRAKAAEYEAGGNATGAAQLRAVQNWIWALLRGDDPGTVLR